MSCHSRLSVNDKDANKVKPGAMNGSPGIYLIGDESPEKTSASRPSDEDSAISHRLKWSPLPPKPFNVV